MQTALLLSGTVRSLCCEERQILVRLEGRR
jgi:hypothetical protein